MIRQLLAPQPFPRELAQGKQKFLDTAAPLRFSRNSAAFPKERRASFTSMRRKAASTGMSFVSRLDAENMRAFPDGLDWKVTHRAALEIEKD